MSKISSTTLFHFLEKKEWLFEILHSMKMSPRYVLEDYPTFKEKYLILMKCFCDIPLSNVINHTNTYGKYGIGLSKEFAFKNFISPVQYFHKTSHPTFALMAVDFENKEDFTFLIPYLKYMFSTDNKVYYYEEREWRYVKQKTVNVTGKSNSEIEKELKELNENVTKKLTIELKHIEYIFLKNQDDVLSLFKEIKKMNFTETEKNFLISKIITIDQIEKDF